MPTDRLDFRFNYSDNQSAFTEPRVQDAIFNTARDLGQLILISEFYGLAGAEPFTAQNLVAGFPGGRVGKWENRSDITRPNEYATRQSALNVNWDLSDSMNLQFTTAQTEQDADSYVDWDNSPYVLVNDYNRQRLEVFSQEIQLTGGGDRITWVGGLYYWDQKTINRNGRFSIEEFRNGRLNPQTALNSPGCQIPIPATPPPPRTTPRWLTCADVYAGHSPGGGSGPFDTLGIAETDGWAAFGEVTIGLSDTLDLSVGLRQHDQSGYSRTLSQIPGVTAPKPLTIYETHTNGDPFAGSIRNLTTGVENPRTPFQFDKLTSRLALQKQFNDDIMGYFSYSEGFNSGGVAVANIPTRPDPRVFFPFEPSTLKNYEFGMRSDWADGRVRFNATVFLTEWIDIQALGAVVNPDTGLQLPTLLTRNIGDAEAQGVEFELTLAPTDSILVNVNLGLLDTAYTQLPAGQTSGHLLWTEGTEFQQAPDTTYNLGFQHTASLGNGGTFVSRIDYSYQAQFWRSDPFLRISAYPSVPAGWSEESGDWGILNMRFTYEPSEGNWQAAVFGTNLTNEYQLNSGFFHGIWGYDFATVGRPREAGAALTFRF
jgi:iron complex outermembrane receptor protein